MIVPERSSQVRRYTIPHRVVMQVLLGSLLFAGGAAFMGVHYFYMVDSASQNRELRADNINLQTRLRLLQDEVARIDGTLQRIEQFSTKVRAITQLSDPARNLAIGPVGEMASDKPTVLYAEGERIEHEDELIDSDLAVKMIEAKTEALETEALRQESNSRELHEYFADSRHTRLANTPSVRPTASKLINSTFGMRTDPYTNLRVMHKGVDFAADHGSEVFAPADGVIVFAGHRGSGYGKTLVVDHGLGVQTHYAHLSAFEVEVGQSVRRGQAIARVGNTGRTTGPHLHYEVRVGGVPQDPHKYMLDD